MGVEVKGAGDGVGGALVGGGFGAAALKGTTTPAQ